MMTQAYLNGWNTFENNRPFINPYDELAQSMEYSDWNQGYQDAQEAYDG